MRNLDRRTQFEILAMNVLALVAVALLVLGFSAHAQTVLTDSSTATPSIGSFLQQWLTPGGLASVIALVLSVLGGFTWLNAKRKRILGYAFFHGYHLVEDIGNELEGEDGFDKTARYLKEVDGWLVKNGWRPLKPGEVELAKLQASSQHGQEIAKEKIAVAAALATASLAPPPL